MRRRPGERERERKCRRKPLAAVASGRQQCQEASRKRGGILPLAFPEGRGAARVVEATPVWPRFQREPLSKASTSFIQLASDMRHFYCNCRAMSIGSSCRPLSHKRVWPLSDRVRGDRTLQKELLYVLSIRPDGSTVEFRTSASYHAAGTRPA